MKVIALCFIALISMTSAVHMLEKYPKLMNFSDKRSIMKVFAQVENHLKNDGPLDAITRILDEYANEIHAEQLAHDQLYEKQTAECNDEFEFRNGEISEAENALKEASETLDGCKQQQIRAKDDLRITKKQLKEKTAELIGVHTTRKREKYQFDTDSGVFAIMHPAILECQDFLVELFEGGGSFLQISRHVNKMLVNAVQIGLAHHMAPVLSSLAQLSTVEGQFDSELLHKLENMFQTFQAKMEAEMAQQIATEEAAIVKYNEDVTRIEGILANLEEQRQQLEDEITELDKCIITQQNIIAQATQKRGRNQRLLNDAISMCAAMDKQYEAAKVGRAFELELLAAIKVKVEEHFANLSGGVVSRGELDDFDSTYENASAYEEKSFTPAI